MTKIAASMIAPVRFTLVVAAVLLALLAYAVTLMIAAYYIIDPQHYFRFFGGRDASGARWLATMTHIVPGVIALLAGPLQFIPALRRRMPAIHRLTGWIYITAVATSLAGAARIVFHSQGGTTTATGFALLGLIWGAATLAGLVSILWRDPVHHRRWMIRSYAVTSAAVSLRFQLQFLIGLVGMEFDRAYAFVAWTSWLPVILLTEIWLRRPADTENTLPHPLLKADWS